MTSPVMTTGYVRTLDPFTVEIPGVDAVAQPCQRNAPAEVGMRGRVDIVDGSRSWAGEWNTDGVPTVVRDGLASVSERIADMAEVSNGTAQSLSDFEVDYHLDQTAAAIELDAIRGSVAGIELEAVTTNRLAVLATGDGAYMDPGFLDPALTQERADNSGLGRADNEIFGTGTFYLSQRGADEGVSLPLQVDSLYSVVVKGDGLTADKRVLAVKWGNGVVTNLPTVYSTNGSLTSMAASVVPTSAGARLLVRAVAGAPMMTVRSVSIRRGIGGTLIEEDSINTTHITTDAIKARHVDTSEVYADLKIVSPNIETNPDADTGIKIVGDRLIGYSLTGEEQIDIGGPEGIIKGVELIGATITGPLIRTAPTGRRIELSRDTGYHYLSGVTEDGREAFALSVNQGSDGEDGRLIMDGPGPVGTRTSLTLGSFLIGFGRGASRIGIRWGSAGPGLVPELYANGSDLRVMAGDQKSIRLDTFGTGKVLVNGKRLDDAPDRLDALESSSPQIQRGAGTMNISASSAPGQLVGRIIVTYPNAFTGGGVPVVMPVARDASTILDKVGLHVESVTNTNFTVRAASTTVHGAISGVTIDWIAIK